MSIDIEILEEFKAQLADKYTAYELVELLEACELITVWDVLEQFEEQVIELHRR